MPAADHRAQARQSVACAVITVSDTRTEADDASGRLMRDLLAAAGHAVEYYTIVKDEPDQIRTTLKNLAGSGRIQAVLVNGGTGIAGRDSTFEAVVGLLDKRLDGFGELFRMLSYQEIGAAAMLSRAVAGTFAGMAIFSTPGSTPAVRLAMEKLVLPELAHVAWELSRQSNVGSSVGCRHHSAEAHSASERASSTTSGPPGRLEAFRPEQFAAYNLQKMGKSTLFESPRILVGLNAFEPGQEHALHAHADMDKLYYVLQGRGLFLLPEGDAPMAAGQMLIAPAGVPHGIRNNSSERLLVLAVLAPGPQKNPPAAG